MNKRKLTAVLFLANVLVASAAIAKSPDNGMGDARAEIARDAGGFHISAPDHPNFIQMSVKIKTEGGDVIFEDSTFDGDLVFDVDESLPDGEYWYIVDTVIMISAELQAVTPSNPDHIIATQRSRFYVVGGNNVSENEYLRHVVRISEAMNDNTPSAYLLSLAETVADFFVGSAQADITVTDGANCCPQIFFNDDGGATDTGTESDWEIFGNASNVDTGFFRIRNNLGVDGVSNIFGIDGSATSNGGMTLLIQEDGDVEFGSGRAAFLESTTEPQLVIGDVDATFDIVVNLEIIDDLPYLLFRDTDTDANAGLFVRTDEFVLEGTTFADIFRFNLSAPDNAFTINSIGNMGLGTDTPGSAVDVIRSAAPASFRLTSSTDTANQAPQFVQRRSGGTSGAPTALNSGDNIGLVSFRGHTGSAYTGTKATVAAQATEAWTPTANGTKLIFGTTQNGTTGLNNVLEVTHDGKVKINGTTLNVPDYVFEEDYALMSLDDLSTFVKKNKHLPGVANAEEVKEDGLDIAGSQLSVLEKVEELTLYTLQQHTQIMQLEATNLAFQAKVAKVDQLEQMVNLLFQHRENDQLLTAVNH